MPLRVAELELDSDKVKENVRDEVVWINIVPEGTVHEKERIITNFRKRIPSAIPPHSTCRVIVNNGNTIITLIPIRSHKFNYVTKGSHKLRNKM